MLLLKSTDELRKAPDISQTQETEMRWSVQKCSILLPRRHRLVPDSYKLQLEGEQIPVVSNTQYLAVGLKASGQGAGETVKQIKKANNLIGALQLYKPTNCDPV